MTAIENSNPGTRVSPAGDAAAAFQWVVLLIVAASFAATVLVFYPGYSTADARYVYADALAWDFGDWQSPAMGVLWRLIDPLAPGSLSMFLLTAALYWLAFGMLALIIARRSVWLGLLTPLAAFAPPAFFFIGMIWRDVLFGVVWLLAAVLAFTAAERVPHTRRWLQAMALALIAFGVLLRPNAVIAAPLLAAYVMWSKGLHLKQTAIAFLPALILFVALVPLVYYGLLGAKRQNPLHAILVFDLGGITRFTGENQFPVVWSPEQTAMLAGPCYDPVRWDSYWHVPPCPFVMQRLERPDDVIFGTGRLVAAWWHALTRIRSLICAIARRSAGSFSPARTWFCRSGIGSIPRRPMATGAPSRLSSRCTMRCSRPCCFVPGYGSFSRPRSVLSLGRPGRRRRAPSHSRQQARRPSTF